MELSREVMLGMIRQGQNGDQILQILDVIVSQFSEPEDVDNEQDAEVGEAELALA